MSIRKEASSMEAPCSSGNADQEQLFVADWAPIHSISMDSFNVGGSNAANIERIPSRSCFGSGSLAEIMNSFNLQENTQLDFPSTVEEKNFKGKKRKKMPDISEGEQENNVQTETVNNAVEKDEKKQKNESSDTNKEDYIHIRARRGQATNSHSLAERVRREKISERMRLLQDLVPGCNKITGKAVMLDEIINYVQSLQRQVEFLSMKLATVNPEMNLDINQIIRKENLHSHYGGSSQILGYFPELVSSLPQLQPGIAVPSLPSSRDLIRTANNLQISSMAQISSLWDNEFHNALQMSFIPNLPHNGMELNGNDKRQVVQCESRWSHSTGRSVGNLKLHLILRTMVFERQIGSNKHSVFILFSVIVSFLFEVLALVFLKDPSTSLASGPYGLIFASFVPFYYDIPVSSRLRVFGVPFTDKSFIYLAGLQLLFSSWKRSLIPGLCGVLAGSFYRLNVFRVRTIKFPDVIGSFFSSLSLPSSFTSFHASSAGNARRNIPSYASHQMQGNYPPAAQPSAPEFPSETYVAALVSMGFDSNSARQALIHAGNDVNVATNILLEAQSR